MSTEPITLFRCVWRDGNQERQSDLDTQDAAERFERWMGRKTPPIKVIWYAVKIWPNDEEPAA